MNPGDLPPPQEGGGGGGGPSFLLSGYGQLGKEETLETFQEDLTPDSRS